MKFLLCSLTHWGWVMHICISKLSIIGSDNGLSPGWRQAIIWTSVWILLIGPLVTNFSEILIRIHIVSFKKMHLKMSSEKLRPFWPQWVESVLAADVWYEMPGSPAGSYTQEGVGNNYGIHVTGWGICMLEWRYVMPNNNDVLDRVQACCCHVICCRCQKQGWF